MKNLKEKYGNWALVTGASSGIGEEFAKQLTALKFNIVLVARTKELMFWHYAQVAPRQSLQKGQTHGMNVEDVVLEALKSIGKKPTVVPGFKNKLLTSIFKLCSRKTLIKIGANVVEKMRGQKMGSH